MNDDACDWLGIGGNGLLFVSACRGEARVFVLPQQRRRRCVSGGERERVEMDGIKWGIAGIEAGGGGSETTVCRLQYAINFIAAPIALKLSIAGTL